MSLFDEAMKLKEQKNAAVVAHYYVSPEVQEVADFVGDSFKLAKIAGELESEIVVFCGVRFMGESAKLLCPRKRILLPEPQADCPMAHMASRALVNGARSAFGKDLAVVCYVNSTAEVKAWSDVCVTSSNALAIVSALPQRHILFIPDKNLGAHLADSLPEKHFVFGEGCCPVHEGIEVRAILDLMERYPQAFVLAHPECSRSVRQLADCLGSTSALIEAAVASETDACIIATAAGVEHQMSLLARGKAKRFLLPEPVPVCADMRKVTLERVVECLRSESGEVYVPDDLAERARRPLQRMMDLAGGAS